MRAVEVLARQMQNVNTALQSLATEISPDEWLWRPGPGQNLIGFTVLHVPCTQDWAINTWMRNVDDVRQRPEWAAKMAASQAAPFGMSLPDADEMARTVTPADALAYSDAVLDEAVAWLQSLSDEDLDHVPETHAHQQRRAAYRAPGYVKEIDGMRDQQYWRLLSGACIGHCRGHLGELELALQLKRASAR